MDEIEQFAGIRIGVEEYPETISESAWKPTAPSLKVHHDRATIYLRDLENPNPQGYLHELLHIHRYWVEGVPQIAPDCDEAANLEKTGLIENNLEHLIIVPREAQYGFDTFPYWNEEARRYWANYPGPSMPNDLQTRRNCLIGWLGCKLVNDRTVVELATEALRSEGLLFEAEKFEQRISTLLSQKARALSCALRFLQLPREGAHLVYFDVRARTWWKKPIPAN